MLDMRKKNYLLCYLCILGATAFGGLQPGTCDIKFLGTSTLHDFHGSVSSAPFELDFQNIGQTNYSVSGTITVAVAEMDTGNKKRDKKMRKMFEEDQFPLISVEVENLLIPVSPQANSPFTREALLIINDKKCVKQVIVSDCSVEGNTIFPVIKFPVSLAEFGLKPPGVMGLIKVGDIVEVTAILTLDLPAFRTEIK